MSSEASLDCTVSAHPVVSAWTTYNTCSHMPSRAFAMSVQHR